MRHVLILSLLFSFGCGDENMIVDACGDQVRCLPPEAGLGGTGDTVDQAECVTDDDCHSEVSNWFCDNGVCNNPIVDEGFDFPVELKAGTPPIDHYLDRQPGVDWEPPGSIAVGTGGDDTVAYWRVALVDILFEHPMGAPARVEMCNGLIVEDREVIGIYGNCDDVDVIFDDTISPPRVVVPLTSAELLFTLGPGPVNTLWYTEVRFYWEK